MIVQEHFEVNGVDFVRTYSDANRYVVGGEPQNEYSEACDPASLNRTYTEGRVMDDSELSDILGILLGVSE